jgi:tripartite-type tricarboxylate transporter receptor subunit TctC
MVANGPDEFAQLIRAERSKWREVIKAAKIAAD